MTASAAHRHGRRVHSHPHTGRHRHVTLMLRVSQPLSGDRAPGTHHHGHAHGLVDPSIVRSRAGLRAVSWSLALLTATALAQAFIYSRTLSVALLADLIHNFGDALTAIPLGVAFFLRSERGERWAGLCVVLAIFISALVALGQTIERLVNPRTLSHLWLLAAAGAIGFVGNEIAAQIRLRAGRRLDSPALVADGNHARVDGFVSLGDRKRRARRSGTRHRRPNSRARDHARHPQDHVGLLAHGARRRPRPH